MTGGGGGEIINVTEQCVAILIVCENYHENTLCSMYVKKHFTGCEESFSK